MSSGIFTSPKWKMDAASPALTSGTLPEELREIRRAARAAGGDDRDAHALADRLEHLQVEAALDAVRVDGVHDHLARAHVHALPYPADGLDARVVAPAAGEHAELAVHALHVHGEHHALVAVAPRRAPDQLRVADGCQSSRSPCPRRT